MKIDENAKIIITQKIKFGNGIKTAEFVIELEPEKLGALEASRRYFKKLQEIQPQASESFNKQIIKILQRVLDHNDSIEKQIYDIQEKVQSIKL